VDGDDLATRSVIFGCFGCSLGVAVAGLDADAADDSAIFCLFRAVGPSGLTVRGLRGFFSFGFSSGADLPSASGSFFLRGFLTFSAVVVVVVLVVEELGVMVFLANGVAELELTTPSELRNALPGLLFRNWG